MKINVELLKKIIRQYYKDHKNREVEPSISVGKIVPSSKYTAPGVIYFEISERVQNKFGEEEIKTTPINDDINTIVSTVLDDLGYDVTEIKYEGIPGQEVSFAGLNVTCEKKSLDKKSNL